MKDEALELVNQMNEVELEEIIGAQGAINTISHECHMNSWQFLFTCCS